MCLSGRGLVVGSYGLSGRGLEVGSDVTFWQGVDGRQLLSLPVRCWW
jgi:hypothetical protein